MDWNEIAEGKAWWQSRSIWGGLIAASSGIGAVAGLQLDPESMAAGVNYALAGTAAIGGLISVVGRMVAKKPIGR